MGGPGAATTVGAVIGSPVRQSRSPAIHNAAFVATGLDWVYLAFEVTEGTAQDALRGASALGFGGLSVTMPIKDAIAGLVDELTPTAARLGAVNTVSFREGRTIGDNTDGEGFLRSLRSAGGWEPAGAEVVVVGAGGAARAVIDALAGAGAASVAVLARNRDRAAAAARLGGGAGRVGSPDDLRAATLVVNATPVGMAGTAGSGATPFDVACLRPGQVVADLVYHPLETPLLVAAGQAGATAVDGLGMLVHQAALQFERWTGVEAPLADMERAARTG